MANSKGASNYPHAEHAAYMAQQEKVDNYDMFPAWTAAQATGPTKGSPNLLDDYGAAIASPFILGYTGPRYLYEKWKADKLRQQYLNALPSEAEYKSTGGLQGYKSQSGFGGINYDYLSDLPKIEYGKNKVGEDFTYGGGSGPLSGGDSGDGAANQPTTMNAWDYNLPSTSPYNDPKSKTYRARNFNPPVTNPYESHNQPPAWDPKTADEMWDKLDDQVYNAGTNKWEHSGDWSYPGSKLFPERMGMIDNLLTFGTTNPADGLDYKNIAQDLANRQQRRGDLAHAWVNNPDMSHEDYDNLIHHDWTGFDSQGNFNPLPGSEVFNSLPQASQDHFQNIHDPFHDIPDHSQPTESLGWFGFNKGGQVSGGK